MNTPLHNTTPSLFNLSTQTEFLLGDTTIIGRHEDCNMVLKSERGASRKHARITVENNVAVLMDLGSLNGTLVNGREISQAVQLTDGDILIFDEQKYQFSDPNTPAQSNSDSVTVIANKDEIGQPGKIKPAIRVVEPTNPSDTNIAHDDYTNGTHSLDDTEAWQVPQVEVEFTPDSYQQHSNQIHAERQYIAESDDFTAIPATSRPGGDAPKPRRRREALLALFNKKKPKPIWLRWFVAMPLLVLLILIAFNFAYAADFTAVHFDEANRS